MASVTMEDRLHDESEEWLSEASGSEGDDSYDEDSDVDGFSGPTTASGSQSGCMRNGYRVLVVEQAKSLQRASLQQVSDLLHCSRTVARTLLIHYRWDPERIASIYVDKGLDELYKTVGLPLPAAVPPKPGSPQIQCQICYDTVDVKSCPTMLCGHLFCTPCWVQHFKVGIADGKARNLRCMEYKCGAPCDEDVVLRLLANTPEADKFQDSLATSYVEDNSMAGFCPSTPWCGHAIVVSGDVVCEPECVCGHMFCFKCKRAPHSPCTCQMWDMWEEKTQGDSETRNWIMANTKPCPKCQKPVEKNGGCNHVTCKCGQSFCWLCGASTGVAHTYSSIEGHTCGRWKEEMDRKATSAAESHKRYIHYFERWKAHMDSYKKEGEKKEKFIESMSKQVDSGLEARHYDWLIQAVDQLKVARRMLAPSYVFAYFTFGQELYKDQFSPDQNRQNQQLFEDQQQMLESEVERLSSLTDTCNSVMNAGTTLDDAQRVSVINSTVSIERRIVKFYDMVQEILDQLPFCSAQIASFTPTRKTIM